MLAATGRAWIHEIERSNTIAADEQHERGLLAGECLHRQADAEALLRVVDADTSFRAVTRTSPD
jgi:hypothetical protein